jgi:hypothetical protein
MADQASSGALAPLSPHALLSPDADLSDLAPWEHRLDLGESNEAYHAFEHFRDLDTSVRTLNQAYRNHMAKCRGVTEGGSGSTTSESEPRPLMIASGCWRQWKATYKWDERIALFEAYNDRLERQRQLADIRQMNRRHASLAITFQNRIIERMQAINLNDIEPKLLGQWFKIASDVERRARGEATEIVQNENNVNVSVSTASELRRRLKAMGILQEISQTLDGDYTVDIMKVDDENKEAES